MQRFKEYYELGTKKYTKHTKKMTPGEIGEGPGKSESWEAGYKRRVVKTSKPEHKEKGYKWRIKGKDRLRFLLSSIKQSLLIKSLQIK